MVTDLSGPTDTSDMTEEELEIMAVRLEIIELEMGMLLLRKEYKEV